MLPAAGHGAKLPTLPITTASGEGWPVWQLPLPPPRRTQHLSVGLLAAAPPPSPTHPTPNTDALNQLGSGVWGGHGSSPGVPSVVRCVAVTPGPTESRWNHQAEACCHLRIKQTHRPARGLQRGEYNPLAAYKNTQ
jgi:hypothetical protein